MSVWTDLPTARQMLTVSIDRRGTVLIDSRLNHDFGGRRENLNL